MDEKCSYCNNETKVICPDCKRPACKSHASEGFCIQQITGDDIDICIICEYEQTGTIKRLYSWNEVETAQLRKCIRFLLNNDENRYNVPEWFYE